MTDQTDWYSDDQATLGDRIAAAREAAGLSQKELARRLGVGEETMVRWEDDRAEPRANRLSMLSGMLGVSLRWLLNGEGDGPAADAGDVPHEIGELLDEVRSLQLQIARAGTKLAAVEKRLRRAWRSA